VLMATHNYQIIQQYPKRVLKCEQGQLIDSAVAKFELKREN
jgi:cell division transport system ATP-binding protein